MKKREYSYSGEFPVLLERAGKEYQVNFDVEEITVNGAAEVGKPMTQYRCLYARVPKFEYGMLVSAIIGTVYSQPDTEAVLLNYQLAADAGSGITPEKRAEYNKEYQQLQAWRTHAKEVAKECMK